MSSYVLYCRLADPNDHDFGAVAVGFGNIGEKGFVSHRDVCLFLDSKKTKSVFNGDMRVPYAYKETEWISYDDVQSLSYKVNIFTHDLNCISIVDFV